MSASHREGLIQIITASFVHIEASAYLDKYFYQSGPFQRKLRLYFNEEQLVGYCLLTFSQTVLPFFSESRKAIIIKASAAFLPEYRQGGNTFAFSLRESLKSWMRQPWKKHYYADTMLSPAMYRAIAKHTGIIWPHFSTSAPRVLFEHFNSHGIISPNEKLRCLVPVDRSTNYSQQEIQKFKESDKPEIIYYCQLNPDFDQDMALFVIIPVNIKQLILTLKKRLFK